MFWLFLRDPICHDESWLFGRLFWLTFCGDCSLSIIAIDDYCAPVVSQDWLLGEWLASWWVCNPLLGLNFPVFRVGKWRVIWVGDVYCSCEWRLPLDVELWQKSTCWCLINVPAIWIEGWSVASDEYTNLWQKWSKHHFNLVIDDKSSYSAFNPHFSLDHTHYCPWFIE